ncbi:MAG: hypothetical protein J5I98_32390 [Phaeodactylibacter sp.]|nr:hypothetical protein [Phaeodactylibacter sp.]
MIVITAYTQGWKAVFRNSRMWLALYLFNLLLALLAALPFSGYLGSTVGQSLAAEGRPGGFDYTLFNDFLREYGQGLAPVLDTALGFLLLYLLLSVFLMGGILLVFLRFGEPFRWGLFWQGCTRLFWRLLRLTVYFLLLQGTLLGLFGLLFYLATGGFAIFEMETELELVRPLYYLLPLYLLAAVLVFMVQDYAKIHVAQEGRKWLARPLRQAFGLVFRNFGPFFLLYLLNISTLLLLSGIYWSVSRPLSAAGNIALIFLWGQLFIFGRVGLRLLNLASAAYLYRRAVQYSRAGA